MTAVYLDSYDLTFRCYSDIKKMNENVQRRATAFLTYYNVAAYVDARDYGHHKRCHTIRLCSTDPTSILVRLNLNTKPLISVQLCMDACQYERRNVNRKFDIV